MERLVSIWRKHEEDQEDLQAAEELSVALNDLSIAHIAATFKWANGPLEWDNSQKTGKKK